MKLALLSGVAVSFAVMVGIVGAASTDACTPAQSAEVKTFEGEFLANYQQGLAVVEGAFVALDPALAGVAGLVDQLIVDTITLLEDAGAFGDAGTSVAEAIKSQASGKVEAFRAQLKSRQ